MSQGLHFLLIHKNSEFLWIETLCWEGRTTRDQGDPAGSAGAKQGERGDYFPETNCKKRLSRRLPGQNPGLRKVVGIQERKCRARGKGYHTNTASCKEELDWMELYSHSDLCLHCRTLLWVGEKKALSSRASLLSPSHCSWGFVSGTASSRG